MSTPVERLAGTDTREAAATLTVRLVAMSAFVLAGPAWAATFGSRGALETWLGLQNPPGGWWVAVMAGTALAACILSWRSAASSRLLPNRWPRGSEALGVMTILVTIVLVTGTERFGALALLAFPAICGWFFGRAARIAAEACVAHVGPAAIGIVTVGALGGIIFAGPLIAAGKSGVRQGAAWVLVFVVFAAIHFLRAWSALPLDRAHSEARAKALEEPDADHGAAFECEGVAVSFGSNRVLRQVDLKARPGELVALVGANGAGKSTLLRIAAGLTECRAGRVSVGGHGVTMLRAEERAELGLAFVSGARPIFPDLTVLENLRVAAYLSHIKHRSFAVATDAIFELVPALKGRQHDRAGVLSGGEQRILAVAQSLYRRPVALLADELTLGLATDARLAVFDLLRILADDGVAVIVVDHDLASLLPRADRAILLADGKAQSFDDPMKVLDQRKALLPATFLAQVPT